MDTTTKSDKKKATVLYPIANWALSTAGLANLGIGTFHAVQGFVALAATSLTAGLVLLFAGTIERFELLQGLGMTARTKKLDEKLEQADEALSNLRALAELTGAALIEQNSKIGRWTAAPTPKAQYELAQSVRSTLDTLGSTQETIAATLRPWIRTTMNDLAYALTDDLREAINARRHDIAQRIGYLSKQPINPTDPEYLQITSDDRALVEFLGRTNSIGNRTLEDYPEDFLRLFDEVPILDEATIAPFRIRARSFAPAMQSIKETLGILDAQRWFAEIEYSRERANPVGAALARHSRPE
jgi:hypothetical protein